MFSQLPELNIMCVSVSVIVAYVFIAGLDKHGWSFCGTIAKGGSTDDDDVPATALAFEAKVINNG